jgi:mono/diheme cytochrome c family protein
VVRPPQAEPIGLHPPGGLDKSLLALTDRGGMVFDPAKLSADDRARLDHSLNELFGTPAAPRVEPADAERPLADSLGLSAERLTAGGRLYKDKCVQCHGMAGDGRGPTGQWVYPHPRDFRSGVSKFASTPTGRPTREDLVRSLRIGVSGNAMPPFTLLADDQLAALAAYTVYLSLRGRVEYDALVALLGDGLEEDLPAFARGRLKSELKAWAAAEAEVVRPGSPPDLDDPDRIRLGLTLFAGPGGCASCHADYGRKEQYRYDVWGVAVRPANLTLGDFHGGKEPADLFRRVRCGIPGSGMPAAPVQFTDEQVWALVAFVRALPVPRGLPPDVRAAVYPDSR